jgi:hypothetical protein
MSGSRFHRSLRSTPRWVLTAALTAVALPTASAAARDAKAARAADAEAAGLANVTFTGFRMLADGRSLVYVELTSKVAVSVEKRGGNVFVYRLDGAQVALKNNKNPLITSGFASLLDSARWVVPSSKGKKKPGRKSAAADASPHVDLVLTLRDAATPTHVMRDGKAGAILEITLPASAAR